MKNRYFKYFLSILLFIFILYPFIVFYLLTHNYSYRFIGIIFSLFIIIKFLSTKSMWQFIIGAVLCLSVFFFQEELCLKLYPCLMNFSFFLIFYSSSYNSLIEHSIHKISIFFHTKFRPSPIDILKIKRQWIILLLINTIISVFTLFTSLKIWTLYNGLISYILIGCLVLFQFLYYNFKKKYQGLISVK